MRPFYCVIFFDKILKNCITVNPINIAEKPVCKLHQLEKLLIAFFHTVSRRGG